MADQCPTCSQAPAARDTCADCGVELEDVFGNPSARQYRDALEVALMGGYGMFFDNIDGDHHVFLCHDCVLKACAALPWMARVLNVRTDR